MNFDSIPVLDLMIALLLLTTITITYMTPYALSGKQEAFQKYYKNFILQQKILHEQDIFQCRNITLNKIIKSLDTQYPIKIINNNRHIEIIIQNNENHDKMQFPIIFIECGDIDVKIYENT